MNNLIRKYSLEEVLDAYVAEAQRPNREALAEWAKRFPQYTTELADFTVAWIQTEHIPEYFTNKEVVAADAPSRANIGVKMAQRVYEIGNALAHL